MVKHGVNLNGLMQNSIFTILSGVSYFSQKGSGNPQTFQTEGPPSPLMTAYIGAGDPAFFGVPPVKFHLGLHSIMCSNSQGTHFISMELYFRSSQQLSRDLTNAMSNLIIKIC